MMKTKWRNTGKLPKRSRKKLQHPARDHRLPTDVKLPKRPLTMQTNLSRAFTAVFVAHLLVPSGCQNSESQLGESVDHTIAPSYSIYDESEMAKYRSTPEEIAEYQKLAQKQSEKFLALSAPSTEDQRLNSMDADQNGEVGTNEGLIATESQPDKALGD